MLDSNPGEAPDGALRTDVTAACIALLVRELHGAGVGQAAAFACLGDAPDKIGAALARGADALVLYRLDRDKPRGIVGHRDDKLKAFAAEAAAAGAPLFGLNPNRIAGLATAARGDLAERLGVEVKDYA